MQHPSLTISSPTGHHKPSAVPALSSRTPSGTRHIKALVQGVPGGSNDAVLQSTIHVTEMLLHTLLPRYSAD